MLPCPQEKEDLFSLFFSPLTMPIWRVRTWGELRNRNTQLSEEVTEATGWLHLSSFFQMENSTDGKFSRLH